MRKKLKKKLLEHGYHLYDQEWVEKAATKGFNNVMAGMHEKEPVLAAAIDKCKWPFEVMYYTAFEDALNTFLLQCLDDDMHEVQLCLDELHKVTATFFEKEVKDESADD